MRAPYRNLITLASTQGGYFSAAQAVALGIARPRHSGYVASGEWTREAHGLYRLSDIPETDPVRGQYHLWLLWTVGRRGETRAAFAYETAMAIYGMSDLQPSKIHLSVPKTFRRSVIPKPIQLHIEERDVERDVWEWDGLRVVRPFITIVDLEREERISQEHIERGFIDGYRKGIITDAEISAAFLSPRERRLFDLWKTRSTT